MEFEQILAFSSFAFVASATPGPNNVILMATGREVGTVKGLPVLAGIVLGLAFMIFILALGFGNIINEAPRIQYVIKYIGIALLLWIAWQIASAPIEDKTKSDLQSTEGPKSIGFLKVAVFQWVNPKAWISCTSAITTYFSNELDLLPQASIFAMIFILAALLGCIPWLVFGSTIKHFLKNKKASRIFNVSMGLILFGSIFAIIK